MRLQDKSEHVAHNILHNSVVKVKCRGGLKRGSGWGRGLESPPPPHEDPPQRNHKHVVLTQVQARRCVHKLQRSVGDRGWREEGRKWLHVGGQQHVFFILLSMTVSVSVYWHPHSPVSVCAAFLCNGNAWIKFYFAACLDVFIGVAAGHCTPSDYLLSRLWASSKKSSSSFLMWDSLM